MASASQLIEGGVSPSVKALHARYRASLDAAARSELRDKVEQELYELPSHAIGK